MLRTGLVLGLEREQVVPRLRSTVSHLRRERHGIVSVHVSPVSAAAAPLHPRCSAPGVE